MKTEGQSWKILAATFRTIIGGVGWIGAFFVAYSVISEATGQHWAFIEAWGPFTSSFLTIAGTLLTGVSIYFYKLCPNPPEKFSIYVSAPVVIIGCFVALWFLITRGSLPVMLINGFAILGIAGGFFRLQINPGTVR